MSKSAVNSNIEVEERTTFVFATRTISDPIFNWTRIVHTVFVVLNCLGRYIFAMLVFASVTDLRRVFGQRYVHLTFAWALAEIWAAAIATIGIIHVEIWTTLIYLVLQMILTFGIVGRFHSYFVLPILGVLGIAVTVAFAYMSKFRQGKQLAAFERNK